MTLDPYRKPPVGLVRLSILVTRYNSFWHESFRTFYFFFYFIKGSASTAVITSKVEKQLAFLEKSCYSAFTITHLLAGLTPNLLYQL